MSQQRRGAAANTSGRRTPTRRQISRREQERRRQRIAIALVLVLVVVAVLVVLVPFVKRSVLDPRQTLAVVGAQTVRRSDYDAYQRLSSLQLQDPSALGQLYDAYQRDQNGLRDSLKQALTQAPPATGGAVDASTLNPLIDNTVLVQSAGEAGVNLTDLDVESELRKALAPALGNDKKPANSGTATAGPASATAAAPATETAPSATATFPPLPQDKVNDLFKLLDDTTGVSRGDYEALVLKPAAVRDRYTARNTPKAADQVHARHILVDSEGKARDVLKQLKSGTKFEVLARKYSTDDSNKLKGGDLGWATRETYVPEFARAAFALKKPGQLSEPVKTQFGWHIIQLLERGNDRPLTPEQQQTQAQQKLSEFIKQQREALKKQDRLDIKVPPTPTPLPGGTPTPAEAPRG